MQGARTRKGNTTPVDLFRPVDSGAQTKVAWAVRAPCRAGLRHLLTCTTCASPSMPTRSHVRTPASAMVRLGPGSTADDAAALPQCGPLPPPPPLAPAPVRVEEEV